METAQSLHFASASRIAQRFVAARLNAVALDDYPGSIPPDLASAYECQDAAIALWPDDIAGWKIGRIPPAYEAQLGVNRLAGPIFRREIQKAQGGNNIAFGIFADGFAAVEAEYIFEIGKDAPAGQAHWSPNDAAAIVGRLFVGIETAGSPLATINALGPTVVVSDFGNNAGLILGPEITDWRNIPLTALTCETFVEGKSVGRGGAASILGGPLESLQFIAEHCAKRGRPLKAGMLISTGAATGIHDVAVGQKARVDFEGIGTIYCTAKARMPMKQ
ncbi:MAG: fumarylacetoacetate hydrolase family protein [Alphaproteobacteria bacterium]|nr:fumarylacetoacetate hydrolase family protein [Alphaproteobacteria bacterium]MDE2112257.1 fumarylacetoacetate hydrolase family protein [Alphaproteobacteria bacterium]MDE2495513.1 fumarylacetoacetate hydrolase family protein [Alphaproteobacteria bacterium]